MADATVTLTNVKLRSVGNRRQGTATISVVSASSDTYPTGGIPMPTGWRKTMGCATGIDFGEVASPLTLATEDVALTGKLLISDETLFLYGAGSSAAEDIPFEQLPDDTVIATGTYTSTLVTQGY